MLFYLQRSLNRNTVVYSLNRTTDGNLNPKEPIKIYWICYEKNAVIEDLNPMEWMAYGIDVVCSAQNPTNFEIHFNAFKKKIVYLLPVSSKTYKAFTTIQENMCSLRKVYINSTNNALGFPIKVNYMELTGENTKTGEINTEIIRP